MVGTAVLRLSNCVTNDISMDDDNNSSSSSSDVMDNDTMTNTVTCENEPVDIAVTLALLVGVFMVSAVSYIPLFIVSTYRIVQKFDWEKL